MGVDGIYAVATQCLLCGLLCNGQHGIALSGRSVVNYVLTGSYVKITGRVMASGLYGQDDRRAGAVRQPSNGRLALVKNN